MAARQRSNDWVERALLDWSAWVQSQLDAQGWGGGAERDVVANVIYGRPQRNGHSNPLLAELEATLADSQGQNQRVHTHLCNYAREYSRDWMRVVWARFVGEREATSMRVIVAHGAVQVAATASLPITIKQDIPRTWKWSGLQEWSKVAVDVGLSERSCKEMLSQVKRYLKIDLNLDKRTRRGEIGHDRAPAADEGTEAGDTPVAQLCQRAA